MSKDALRARARATLRALAPDARAAAEAEIARRVWTVPEVAGARTLLIYASLPDEVATDAIADEARRRGIVLVYPRCLEDRTMALHAVDSPDALRPGRFGIREPDADACPIRRIEDVDAALVPGLAWDRAGHRLGRGAGYYDRMLSDPAWRGFRCGLFFAAQETPAVPRDAWDVRLDAIVTDVDVVRINTSRSVENPLAGVLLDYWTSDRPHHERLILTAAVISTALLKEGMRATLVGGGAIELHAPGVYRTGDIDLVVEGRSRDAIDRVMRSLGLVKRGRHWVMNDLFVEVPGNEMDAPVEIRNVDGFDLRVAKKESVLAERIVGFRHWKYWGYGIEAIAMMRTFRYTVDERVLREMLRREGAEHAYDLLRELALSEEEVTIQRLDEVWHAHYR